MNTTPPDSLLRRALLVLVLAAVVVAVGMVVVRGIYVLMAAFAGVLLAVVLNAGARALADRTPLGYGVALTTVVLLLAGVLGGSGWLLGGQVAAQAGELGELLPEVASEARSYLEDRPWGQWLLEQVNAGDEGGGGGEDSSVTGGGGTLIAVFGALSNFLTYLLVTVFVGLFGAANPGLYTGGVLSLTPPRHRPAAAAILDALGYTLRRWMLGQGLAMVIIGVSTTVMLWLFGIPLAMVVGLIVGLLGFIPYLGPIIGVVPVVIVAAPGGATILLWVLLAYTAVQMVEGYGITPLIFERTVYLAPIFTIVMQITLGAALGIMGIVLATPLAAVLLVLSRAWRRYVFGDDVPLQPSGTRATASAAYAGAAHGNAA
ncbi:MAG TPA: AI-2E family transporter [Longimicrobiales bacterium]|nr:AI-2E family transporter [Longimicrobiales bacterium]